MEFSEVVLQRRSIRRFKDKKIPYSNILSLLDCARLCQSANNRQPWIFKIAEGAEKEKIHGMLLKRAEQTDNFPAKESAKIIENASALILIFKKKDNENLVSDLLSIGAAMEHICLRAVDLGLGSVCIGDLRIICEGICKSYLFEDTELVISIAIGYPNEFPQPRKRKSLEDILILP